MELGGHAAHTCGGDTPLRGKHGSQMVRLTDEGWQKVMPNRIELWDVSVFDSFNKQGACGGHQGARLRSMTAGTLS